jgi:hypothetical protein
VGDQQHRGAGVAQLTHGRPYVATRGRVEALGQLVQNDQAGTIEQREHEEQPLPLPAAQRGEHRAAPLRQPELLQQLAAVTGTRGGEQVQRLAHRQPIRQRRVLELAADERPQLRGLRDGVVAKNTQRAAVRLAQPLDALDSCRLPGTVGADQADDLPGTDIKVQAVHHDPCPVRLSQTSHGHNIKFTHVLHRHDAMSPAHQPVGRTVPLTQGRESPGGDGVRRRTEHGGRSRAVLRIAAVLSMHLALALRAGACPA